eukprot:12933516-Ditylum_brightwellii.AAC.1
MPRKNNYNKKPIYFKLIVGIKHLKAILPASRVYNGGDKIDATNLKAFFDNVFKSYSTQLTSKNIISNDFPETIKDNYNKNQCIKSFLVQEHKDGPYKEYALSTNSFTHYINQMIDNAMDIRVTINMVNFKNHDFD